MKHKRRGIRREGTLFGEKAGMIAAISVLCIIVIGVSVYMIRNKDSGIIRRRDEVLEIENLNPRDNVVEAEDFEDKDVSWKEKRKLKKETAKASDEKTQSNSENSGSSEDGSGESGNTENGGSQNQGGDTENPDGTETPDTPSLPVVEEPGWTIGIY